MAKKAAKKVVEGYEDKWNLLKSCLEKESKLCHVAYKEAMKQNYIEDALEYKHNILQLDWVLDEMDNIAEKGSVL